MDYIVVALLGICIGSFLNVCIYRIPREESISFPPSHCTNCNYKLRWIDNLPLLSYIMLKGKCRNCKEKISIQYPLIELLNCILYIGIYTKYGVELITIKYMLLSSIMIVIGMIDFKTQYVYLNTIIVGTIIGIIFLVIDLINNKTVPMDNVYGMLIGLGVIGLIFAFTLGRGMGAGDIEIGALAGLFLGVKGAIFMVLSSFIIGSIFAITIMVVKDKGKKDAIAFGPYMAMSTIISLFVGNTLIDMYIKAFF